MKGLGLLGRPWLHFLCLAAALALANLRMARADFLPVHENLWAYYMFHLAYSEFFLRGELPRWLALGTGGGMQFDYWRLFLTPSQYLAIFLGPLLRFKGTLAAYYATLILDQALFVASAYLLALRFCRRPASRLLVGLGAACTLFWRVQPGFNFRIYALLPLILYMLDRFFDERKAWLLWCAVLSVPFALLGMAPYAYLSYGLVLGLWAGVRLLDWRKRPPRLRDFEAASAASAFSFAVMAGVAALFWSFMSHVWDFAVLYPVGRDHETLTVPLAAFLTYGEPGPRRLLQLLYAVPNDFEITFYAGWIPLALAAVSLARLRSSASTRALWVAVAFLGLFACGRWTPVAAAVYYLVPPMKYYRHLHFVLPIVKVLLLMLAGLGLDELLADDETASRKAVRLFQWACGVLILTILALDAVFAGRSPYPTHFPGTGRLPYFNFHFLPAAVLAALAALLLAPFSRRLRAAWIVGLFALEIVAYQVALDAVTPCLIQPMTPTFFQVRDDVYSEARVSRRPPSTASQLIRRGSTWALMDAFLDMDVCRESLRQDGINRGLDRLVRARLGLPLDDALAPLPPEAADLPFHAAPIPPVADRSLLRSLGCEWPKMRLVGKTLLAKDLEDEARLVRQARDLESVAIVRRGEEGVPDDARTDESSRGEDLGPVKVLGFSANRVSVSVLARRKAWLVYSDAYHPGWRAAVDGKPRPVVEVNLGLKGVMLEPGAHDVEMVYDGANKAAGGLLAASAAAGCVLALGGCAVFIRRELGLA